MNRLIRQSIGESKRREYARLRALGTPANHALRGARICARFADLEIPTQGGDARDEQRADPAEGCVRLAVDWSEVDYDDSYLDTWGLTPVRLARARKDLHDRIARDGVVDLTGRVRCPQCGDWYSVDSVCGFVGDEWRDSGYDTEVMAACVEAVDSGRTCGRLECVAGASLVDTDGVGAP